MLTTWLTAGYEVRDCFKLWTQLLGPITHIVSLLDTAFRLFLLIISIPLLFLAVLYLLLADKGSGDGVAY